MSRPHLLIVDDDPGMRHAMGRILGSRYELTVAESAADALERLPDPAPDLAIVDIRMPGADGFELMDRLKQAMPDLDVILMTGSLSDPDRHFVRAIREKAFYFIEKPFDRDVLSSLVERCLELRGLRERNRRHVGRLERELSQARAFQRSLFPKAPRVLDRVRVDARCVPCERLGGDFFDFAVDTDGRLSFVVADVSGHGVSAAMLTGTVKAAFQAAHVDGHAPAAVIDRLAGGIRSFSDERFLTCFCGRLDPERDTLEYVNAGHPPALLRGADGATRSLDPTGTIVSPALCDASWGAERVRFGAGSSLVVLTDGLPEARDEDGFFGDERVQELVRSHGADPALIDELFGAVERFAAGRPADDDRTVLTILSDPATSERAPAGGTP